jgi:hypothetical protein
MLSNDLHRLCEFGPVHLPVSSQQVDVGEVAPAGVDGASLQRGHDLLGQDHAQRVSGHCDHPAEQARDVHQSRNRPHRVTDIDIDVEPQPGCRQRAAHRDANPGVPIFFPNRLRLGTDCVVGQAVVDLDRGDLTDEIEDGGCVVSDPVGTRSTSRVGRRAP